MLEDTDSLIVESLDDPNQLTVMPCGAMKYQQGRYCGQGLIWLMTASHAGG